MHLSFTFFNLISVATLAVLGGVSAQDEGPNYVFKCKTPGEVALTFDDGPSPFTPKLLEHLAAAKIPATFFVLGTAVKEFPDALKAAYNAGHQIALHSNTHADMNTLAPAKILDEYTINLNAVKTTIGITPKMARPPFGNCNAACAKVLEGQMGLNVIQWNCDSNDWQYEGKVADQPKLFTNMQTIINPSNPKVDSFITLQHDIKDYSVAYVPKIIDMIKAKGYTFVTVEQCTAAFAESPTPSSTSSADKITSAFGLNL
ncbi:7062_t:CDS:2, partial [Rhizophagus irregularis]